MCQEPWDQEALMAILYFVRWLLGQISKALEMVMEHFRH